MSTLELLLTHLAVPLGVLQLYARLRRRMFEARVFDPPEKSLFFLLTAYGGWLMVAYVALQGAWSVFMSLVLVYLVLVAPVLMLILVIGLFPQRGESRYHYAVIVAGAAYACLFGIPLLAALLFLMGGDIY